MKNALRILELVNVRWWNACAEYGINLALGLHRRGHEVIVAGQKNSTPLRRAHQLGLSVHATQMTASQPGHLVASLTDLLSLIRRKRIQVLNAHRAEGHVFAMMASKLLGDRVPVIRTRGDVRPPKGHPFNRWLHHYGTETVVLPAEALRRSVQERLRLPTERLEVIPPGVDAASFRSRLTPPQGRLALNWPAQEPMVGILGRLSPVKGHAVFLEAARLVLKAFPSVSFTVIGGDAQLRVSDLQDLATRLGIAQRIRFTGWVQQTARYIEALDIAVVASQGSEVICRVALECMAMGRPVVGTRVNAIPEVIAHEVTGLLVPPGNPEAMSRAILSLLTDPPTARKYGQAGRRRVEAEFTIDRLAQRTEALYRRVLAPGRRGRWGSSAEDVPA